MLFSIITVSYNSKETIEQTILSVLNQTYKNIEYIIIDGGSTDGTIEIIKKYESKISYWVSEPDKGIYDAMNKGASKANGRYIAFLNSDDWYEENTIEIVANNLKNKNFDIVCGIVNYYKNNLLIYSHGSSMNRIKEEMIMHPTSFMKLNLFKILNGFDINYRYVADYDLMLRLNIHGCKSLYLDKVLANFRIGGASSNIKSIKEKNELKRKYCNRNIIKYIIIKYLINIYGSKL